MERRPLPTQLGARFSVAAATAAGVHPKRLGAKDLGAPFRGMRVIETPVDYVDLARAA